MLEPRVECRAGSFVEDGTITYGSAGQVSFVTVGTGAVGPSPVSGWQSGAVIWAVTGGDGRFAGARGLITSNFTVNGDGQPFRAALPSNIFTRVNWWRLRRSRF